MVRAPKSVSVEFDLRVGEISGTWKPNKAERQAAWELFVELVTRISVAPPRADEELMRESLDSLYSLSASARKILRKYGPDVAEPQKGGQYNFGYLTVTMLNYGLRPLRGWHSALQDWESRRPTDLSRRDHENTWSHADELYSALRETRGILIAYTSLLASACGVCNLLEVDPASAA